MKKNISINISGIIFHIEEDGYEKLQQYLDTINSYFSTFEDSAEIIADIESRIAEIFLAKLKEANRQVVTADDVALLVSTMGTVADFQSVEEEPEAADQPIVEPSTAGTDEEQTDPKTKKSKKLYRNGNRRALGGVASGLAHYFNVDAIWIRLLFIILCFGLPGLAIIAYIVMWIVVPESSELEDDQKVKKMYRNPEGKVLGGVANGLAAYFGADRTVIRLLFVVTIFIGGSGLIIYIILWIITPEAKSITEKMQMQGEPLTLSNITLI
ncbi:MAG: PspC domain-containing protein, partial [Bacteroidetes bacterium]|nr:PspC domain-containing protein [Bacteroidota bacterium]